LHPLNFSGVLAAEGTAPESRLDEFVGQQISNPGYNRYRIGTGGDRLMAGKFERQHFIQQGINMAFSQRILACGFGFNFLLQAIIGLAADNTPPNGFVALFNGKDLTGWKGLVANPPKREKMSPDQLAEAQKKADDDMRAHWSVADGVLVFDGKKLEGYNLCADKDYGNFEMYVDWKIDAGGDSGIYLRGSPQVQIWDPTSKPAAGVGSGGLYNNQKNPKDPSVKADKPIGEWNTFHIKMVGDKVTVWLNDQLVVDNVTLENYWERNKPIYEKGQLELQSHSSKLNFKNIYVKELPPSEPTAK
jgi:hypothetical protein